MRILRRMLWRQLRSEWLLIGAIAGIMIVGSACFVMLQSAHRNLRSAQRQYYRETRFADFWIRVKKAPRRVVEELRGAAGVADAIGRIQQYATVDLPSVERPLNSLVLSVPDRKPPSLNQLKIRRGNYFGAVRSNEVIVIDQFARAHGIRPGQWITLILNERRERLLVVGTAISSEFTYLVGPGSIVPDPEQFAVFFVKQTFAEEVLDFESACNEFVGHWSDADPALQRVWMAQLEQLLEPYGVVSTTQRSRQASHQFLDGEIRGLGVSATVLPTAFLIAAALVLNVLMMRIARRQRQIVGTLKAIGYADRELFWHFLKLGLVVGSMAGLVGSLLGFAGSAGMTRVYRDYFEFPRLEAGIYPDTYAWAVAISVVCALAGSLRGAQTVYRLPPAEAMRPERPKAGGAIWLERVSVLWRRLTTPWRLALRSIVRQRFRTFASWFSTSMGAALLTSGFLMVHTVHFLVDFQFRELSRHDEELVLESERGTGVWLEARRLPGVDDAEPLYYLPCTLEAGPYRYKASLTGLLANARLTVPKMADGRKIPVPRHGLIVNRRLADILHVQVGDVVVVRPTRGNRIPQSTRIRFISDGFLGVTAYGHIVHVSHLAGEPLAVNSLQLLTDHVDRHRRARNAILKKTPAVSMVISRHQLIRGLEETILRNMMVFIVVLVGLSATVFLGSLMNASLISLSERQREVATLRALGYTPWQVGGMFFRESALIAGLGTACGLPLGYGLMWLSALPYRTNDLFRIPVVTAPWVWWTSCLLGLIFLLAAHAAVQWRIHRLDFRSALNVRE